MVLAVAIATASWFAKPLLPSLKATQESASGEKAALLIRQLGESPEAGDRLAAAALAHSREPVSVDTSYYQIPYPGGDVPPAKGLAADVLVRSFRRIGIDLQKEVHEDMAAHFREYPQLWDAGGTDTNIDHRRIPNLRRYLERHARSIAPSRDAASYAPGDVVVWSLATGEPHIGIVVPGPGERIGEAWVVHLPDQGIRWEDALFDFPIEAHFRLNEAPAAPAAPTAVRKSL